MLLHTLTKMDLHVTRRVSHLRAFSFSLQCCSSFRILCFSPLRTWMDKNSFNKICVRKKTQNISLRLSTVWRNSPHSLLFSYPPNYECNQIPTEEKQESQFQNVSKAKSWDSLEILLSWAPTVLLSVSLFWRYLPPGGVVSLSFAGCLSSVPGDSAEKINHKSRREKIKG